MAERGLSEAERTCLRWCADCNRLEMGFLGPTVRRDGPLSEYAQLVSDGYARVIVWPEPARACGYWITPKGREALANPPTQEPGVTV